MVNWRIFLVFLLVLYTKQNETSLKRLRNLSSMGPVKCFWLETESMAVFDLKKLKRPINTADYQFQISDDKIVKYNFCEDILDQCHNKDTQISSFTKNNSTECTRFSGPTRNGHKWSLLNESNPDDGVRIEYNSGDGCKFDSNNRVLQNYTTVFEIKCNKEMKGKNPVFNPLNEKDFNPNVCVNTLQFESYEACPLNLYVVWKFLMQFNFLFGAILILIGLFELLLGAKLMIITVFIASCAAIVTVVFIFLFQFIIPNGGSNAIVWVVLAISIICGIVLGYFIAKHNKIFLGILLGGYTGYLLGFFLYNLGLNRIQASPTLILWLTIVICIIVCAVLSYFLMTNVLIISTSLCGAYAIIRGISLYAGGFPDEFYIIDLINNGETEQLKEELTPVLFAYLAGCLILFIIGVIFQYKTRKETKLAAEENENARYFLHN